MEVTNAPPGRPRSIAPSIRSDLARKMVFVGGPRQVGKTTLALSLLDRPDPSHPAYFLWDDAEDRERLLAGELPAGQPLIVLDEIHKFARWRSLLKGFYDKRGSRTSFLVTGSARLDYYRRGGDSLQGRYHYYRLHPFSLGEIDRDFRPSTLQALLRHGGFPEPFLSGNDTDVRRWQREYRQRVVYEDLRDLERVQEVSLIEVLLRHLPRCVGSPLSIQSLRELLEVAHETAEKWISILERLYVVFRIPPYGSRRIRAVKKEKKLYFWDWAQSPEGGPRFENLVASQLLKYCHWMEDTQGFDMELRYLRDTDKREVDFVVLRDERPEFAVECKSGEAGPSPAAVYFRSRTPIPRFFQVHLGQKDYGDETTGVRVLPFQRFCQELGLP